MSQILHFQAILQIDLTWPLTFICDLWPHGEVKGSYITSINQVWFQSDSNFSNEVNFTFWDHLTTWPLMTFVYDLWPHEHTKGPILCQYTKFGSNRTSTFQMRPISHFQPIFQLDLRWPLTLICDLWPHQQMRVSVLHLWPNFGWNPSKHVEVRACFHNRQQQATTIVAKAIPMCLSC